MPNTIRLFFQQGREIKPYLPRLLIFLFLFLPLLSCTQKKIAVDQLVKVPSVSKEISVAKEINAIIAAKQHPYLMRSSFKNRAEDLESLYEMTGHELVWLGSDDSEKNITDTLNLLANASVQGLNPANYDAETLRRKLQSALQLESDDYQQLALYDTAVSISLLRFMHDLHYGRVNPLGINFKLKLREKKSIDFPALIKLGLEQGTLSQLPQSVEPNLRQYHKLKQALATYRQLAANTPPLNLSIQKTLRPGDSHPQIADLRRFLITIGDLPENEKVNLKESSRYKGAIVEGIKKFQQRHGLPPDGIISKDSVAALNVPLSQRVTQIELAMERLRWLPELSNGPSVVVNIPAFQLWAFDSIDQPNANIINMKVVVGRAMKTETPVLMAEMTFIDFMPYWNVPTSILRTEILPKLNNNPNYLAQQNMEMVTGSGNQVQVVTESSFEQLKQGSLRVRQRPGTKNALGRVKFIFPNTEDVYLHDTPANALFSKSRRDFSHGCVRVENPEGLAEFALKNQAGWDREAIQLAMQSPKTQRITLKNPIPVLFFYTTSFFDQYDNLAFYPDIYGHDAVLLGILSKPRDLSDQSLFINSAL
ncbi:MAG: L,D-transpeptidase family protein [Methylobacter sp.]|jgi:murein L,D-transpeptidase YcbB/YkuD